MKSCSRPPKTIRKAARSALKRHRKEGGAGRKSVATARAIASGKCLTKKTLAKMAFLGKHRTKKRRGKRSSGVGLLYGGKAGAKWASSALRAIKRHGR